MKQNKYLLEVYTVTFDRGEKSHATAYKKGQCFGVTTVCRMGPYDAVETSRTPITWKDYPTCKLCDKTVKSMAPVISTL